MAKKKQIQEVSLSIMECVIISRMDDAESILGLQRHNGSTLVVLIVRQSIIMEKAHYKLSNMRGFVETAESRHAPSNKRLRMHGVSTTCMGMFGIGVANGMENIQRIQSAIPRAQKKAITK